MKARILAIASTLAAAASISGCALDPASQQRATVVAIGGTAVAPEQVRISNSTTDLESAGVVGRWHASTPTGEYDCSAIQSDRGLPLQPVCVKK